MQKDAGRETFVADCEPLALRVSNRLRRVVDFIGRWGAWFIVPLVLTTVVDVVARKIVWEGADGHMHGLQIWLVGKFGRPFESTVLQELEWHLHTVLFAFVLGFGTIYNTHVRVDLIRDHLNFRKKVWLEFVGLSVFMIPFLITVIYFSALYAYGSYQLGEISSSTVGLTHRWIIKSVLVVGLIVATLAGVAVWLQVALLLWGDRDRRFPLMTLEWPEEVGSKVEGKERIKLDDAPAQPLMPPVLASARAGLKPAE
jgi:TRAP-type mannitol/chloroaromatic compound transport system permease small subunit